MCFIMKMLTNIILAVYFYYYFYSVAICRTVRYSQSDLQKGLFQNYFIIYLAGSHFVLLCLHYNKCNNKSNFNIITKDLKN